MTKAKKKIDMAKEHSSNCQKLSKRNFDYSEMNMNRLGTYQLLLDCDVRKRSLQDAKFKVDAKQSRREIEGFLIGYSRDLHQQFQQLKMTDSGSLSNIERGGDEFLFSCPIAPPYAFLAANLLCDYLRQMMTVMSPTKVLHEILQEQQH